ncbi:hypothetical protein L9F63_016953, partial [Diploptera punctata]
ISNPLSQPALHFKVKIIDQITRSSDISIEYISLIHKLLNKYRHISIPSRMFIFWLLRYLSSNILLCRHFNTINMTRTSANAA